MLYISKLNGDKIFFSCIAFFSKHTPIITDRLIKIRTKGYFGLYIFQEHRLFIHYVPLLAPMEAFAPPAPLG